MRQEPNFSIPSTKADFSKIRYGQCWEDADILLEALNIQPGDHCLTVASAGDNALALLTRNPGKVVAIDLNPAQIYCLELRAAAYLNLEHRELLEFIGSDPSDRRLELFERCTSSLGEDTLRFWRVHSSLVEKGIGHAGKFERYFEIFRKRVLPLAHSKARVDGLFDNRNPVDRTAYYEDVWNTWRWRSIFKVFFSRFVMGKLGRDPQFFNYVTGQVADRVLFRARHALTNLDPNANPYLQWILRGFHMTALPLALRPEHFDTIRNNLHNLEWHISSAEDYANVYREERFNAFNLSDIFEYVSEDNFELALMMLLDLAEPKARFAYWNMLVPRSRPESLAERLLSLENLAERLHLEDKAFFYGRFVVEEKAE